MVGPQEDTVRRSRQDVETLNAQHAAAASSASEASDVYRRAQLELRSARCSLRDRLQAWREGFRPVFMRAVPPGPPDLVASAGSFTRTQSAVISTATGPAGAGRFTLLTMAWVARKSPLTWSASSPSSKRVEQNAVSRIGQRPLVVRCRAAR